MIFKICTCTKKTTCPSQYYCIRKAGETGQGRAGQGRVG